MLWLAEGLTSFMDELFVYQCGLATIDEYLEMQTKNLNRYFSIHGRRFHSLETSGFNAWDVLYKPTENSTNSSISYYLKGGISFFLLNVLLVKNGSSTKEFISRLWSWYKKTPEVGMEKGDVLTIIQELGGSSARESLLKSILKQQLTYQLPHFLKTWVLASNGSQQMMLALVLFTKSGTQEFFIKSVEIDSAAHSFGLNAGDEIIAINSLRIDRDNISDHLKNLKESNEYRLCRF